ncbi:diguanylate cyclase, partial [Pseudomonas aeruginosa]
MPNPDLSILVVDDAKFSSAMIGRALSQAGYQDIRFASSASEALQQLEQRPVSVLLADWLMPEMDGLELTARVRQLDESINHYTYIVLLTGKEGENVLGEAFDRGVDDFVSKAAMNEQLVPRIYAADRLCNTLQRLLVENRLLTENIARMEERNLVDTLTGLGNPRYLRQKLADSLRQVETRGGALCYLLVGMPEAPVLRQRHGEAFHRELLLGVARRLQQ